MTSIDLLMVSVKYISIFVKFLFYTLTVLTNHIAYSHSQTDMKIINKQILKKKKGWLSLNASREKSDPQ